MNQKSVDTQRTEEPGDFFAKIVKSLANSVDLQNHTVSLSLFPESGSYQIRINSSSLEVKITGDLAEPGRVHVSIASLVHAEHGVLLIPAIEEVFEKAGCAAISVSLVDSF
jgi:hypothetical protein